MLKEFTVDVEHKEVPYTIRFTGVETPVKGALLCSLCNKPVISVFTDEIMSVSPEVGNTPLLGELEKHLKEVMIRPNFPGLETCACEPRRRVLMTGKY